MFIEIITGEAKVHGHCDSLRRLRVSVKLLDEILTCFPVSDQLPCNDIEQLRHGLQHDGPGACPVFLQHVLSDDRHELAEAVLHHNLRVVEAGDVRGLWSDPRDRVSAGQQTLQHRVVLQPVAGGAPGVIHHHVTSSGPTQHTKH